MEKVFEFDVIFDTQKVFRKLMDAMSRPMKKYSILEYANKFDDAKKELLAVGMTLLDNETKFYVEKDVEAKEKLSEYTMAHESEIDCADYIFTSCEMNYAVIKTLLSKAKQGTLADPHLSATLIIWCDSFEGNRKIQVEGPGIDKVRELETSDYIAEILKLHNESHFEYPCGIDLILVSAQGEMMAFPRLCKVKEER